MIITKVSDGIKIPEELKTALKRGTLPFTVAGGIFIVLTFLIDTLAGAPQDENFGTHTAAAAFFKTIGGFAFNFMVPVLAGYIGRSGVIK